MLPVNMKNAGLRNEAERTAEELSGEGIEVLFDDREERPGIKFKDADLAGIPVRVTFGDRITSYNVCYTKLLRSSATRSASFRSPAIFMFTGSTHTSNGAIDIGHRIPSWSWCCSMAAAAVLPTPMP